MNTHEIEELAHKCSHLIKYQEGEIAALWRYIDGLQDEVDGLKVEISKLKATPAASDRE